MSRPTYDVLVAEPDEAQAQIVDMLLASPTYEVTIVSTGRATLEYLQSSTPDVCLLALDLPDVSGDDICSKIRRVTRLSTVPVVLIAPQSGRFGLSDDARRRARKAGATLVLPRPLGDKNLRDRIQGLLDARQETATDGSFSTNVIERALAEIDRAPAGASPGIQPTTSGPAGNGDDSPALGDSEGAAVGPVDDDRTPDEANERSGASDEPSADHLPHAASEASEGEVHHESAELAKLRKEREILQVENTQLKRKLREKQELLDRGENPKLERRVEELERRNAALLEKIQQLEADSEEGNSGGFFGRRK